MDFDEFADANDLKPRVDLDEFFEEHPEVLDEVIEVRSHGYHWTQICRYLEEVHHLRAHRRLSTWMRSKHGVL